LTGEDCRKSIQIDYDLFFNEIQICQC
jgi:hypothetical protein